MRRSFSGVEWVVAGVVHRHLSAASSVNFTSVRLQWDTKHVGFFWQRSSLSDRKLRRDRLVTFSAAVFSSSRLAVACFCTRMSRHLQMTRGDASFSAPGFDFNHKLIQAGNVLFRELFQAPSWYLMFFYSGL